MSTRLLLSKGIRVARTTALHVAQVLAVQPTQRWARIYWEYWWRYAGGINRRRRHDGDSHPCIFGIATTCGSKSEEYTQN